MTVLTDLGREAKRRYKRQWEKAHKEHIRDYNARYWNAKGKELLAEQQINIKNKEEV